MEGLMKGRKNTQKKSGQPKQSRPLNSERKKFENSTQSRRHEKRKTPPV